MFSDQQKLGSEPLVCHRSRLASRFLQFNVLQIRRRAVRRLGQNSPLGTIRV